MSARQLNEPAHRWIGVVFLGDDLLVLRNQCGPAATTEHLRQWDLGEGTVRASLENAPSRRVGALRSSSPGRSLPACWLLAARRGIRSQQRHSDHSGWRATRKQLKQNRSGATEPLSRCVQQEKQGYLVAIAEGTPVFPAQVSGCEGVANGMEHQGRFREPRGTTTAAQPLCSCRNRS
jgi:hypothetical protein